MQKLYYQFPGTWFGDCMPFGHGDKFYLYHQRDTRKPGPFGEPFGWDLATTSDFVHYEDKGVAIPRGTDEEQDQFIFAGSVFEAEGQYHIFYTGYNRDYPALGKPSQVLMHAYSDDLVTWHKTQDALTFTPQEGYDPDDWRDPWVIRDEENDQYITKIKAWQFREEQMKSRISLSLQEVFSRQKDSIIFSIQVITVIIRHLENHLRF